MNVLVTYLSASGNTKAVAEAIYAGIEGKKEIRPMKEVKDLQGYDLVFVGFPIIGKGAPAKARKFLAREAKGKKVALFITHGMPGDMKLLTPMLANCNDAAKDARLLGTYDCQGKLASFVAFGLRFHPNGEVRKWVKAGGERIGVGHPAEADMSKAVAFAKRTIASYN